MAFHVHLYGSSEPPVEFIKLITHEGIELKNFSNNTLFQTTPSEPDAVLWLLESRHQSDAFTEWVARSDLTCPILLLTDEHLEELAAELSINYAADYVLLNWPTRLKYTLRKLKAGKFASAPGVLEQEKGETFYAYLKNSPEIVCVLDSELKIVSLNSVAESYLGYTQTELSECSISQTLTGNSFYVLKGLLAELDASGNNPHKPIQVQLKHLKKDGSEFWGENKVMAHDNNEAIKGYTVITRDISSSIKTEQRLLESENRFRQVLESMPIGAVIITLQPEEGLQIEYANAIAEKVYTLNHKRPGILDIEQQLFAYEGFPERCKEVLETGKAWIDQQVEINRHYYELMLFKISANGLCLTFIDITPRHKAQQALIESEKKYRLLAENATDFIATFTPGLKVTYASPAVKRLLGYSPEEFQALDLSEILTRESYEMMYGFHKIRMEKVNNGQDWHYQNRVEIEVRHKSGHMVHVEYISTPLVNEEGHFKGVLTNARDISKRKQAEKTLRTSEERFAKIFRSSPEPIMITRISDGKIWDVNKAFYKVLKYEYEDIIGKKTSDIRLWPDPKYRERYFEKLFKTGRLENVELQFLDKYGNLKTGIISSEIIEIDGEDHVISVSRDLTERKQVEEQLFFQSTILSQVRNAVCVTTLEHEVVYWNEYARDYYGYCQEDILGKNALEKLFHKSDHSKQLAIYNKVLNDGFWEGETYLLRQDGTTFLSFCVITVLKDSKGQINGFIRVGTDISERKHLEKQLSQAQKMEALGRLIGGVAHDFNNLLTAILGSVELLNQKSHMPSIEKQLKRIKSSAQRGSDLTRKLLTFSRQKKGPQKFINMNDTINAVVEIIEHTIDRRIHLNLSLCTDDLMVFGDENQLELVILNVAINAADAIKPTLDSRPEGLIKITTRLLKKDQDHVLPVSLTKDQSYVYIEVSDTGIGIDEHTLPMIFEPFFTTKEEGAGTGLGLSMSYGTIKNHHGEIAVRSSDNQGATFQIYLPYYEDYEPMMLDSF